MEPDIESATTPFLSTHERDEQITDKSQCSKIYDLKDSPKRWRNDRRNNNSSVCNILRTLLAAWGVLTLVLAAFHAVAPSIFQAADVYRPETLKPGLNLCECGSSLEEAESRGCVYDSLAAGWLPPHCRDDELTAQFERYGPGVKGEWSFFADPNGTIPLSKSEIAALGPQGGAFWATRDWHVAHCLFYWQKYKRIGITGAVMEKRFDSLHHVRHCTHLALVPPPTYFFLLEVPVRMNGDEDTVTPKTTEELGIQHERN